jgi:excisionase family DNA binding protein
MMPGKPGECSTKKAAHDLGVNRQTVLRWCREGRIESRMDASRRYWIPTSDVKRIREDPRSFHCPEDRF